MKAGDVTDTLKLALAASGCDQATVLHKPRLLSDNGSSYVAGDLELQIEAFVQHYNHRRYHESLKNVTPAHVYFGRVVSILREREKIKKLTIQKRRLQHRKVAA